MIACTCRKSFVAQKYYIQAISSKFPNARTVNTEALLMLFFAACCSPNGFVMLASRRMF